MPICTATSKARSRSSIASCISFFKKQQRWRCYPRDGRVAQLSTSHMQTQRFHFAIASTSQSSLLRSARFSYIPSRESTRWIHQATKMDHRAFVALGSNLGDRVSMIERACKEMDSTGKIRVVRTSSLWETKAMYVLDQDKFVNGVCEVRTTINPHM